jgi:hypothetical protein
MELYQEVLSCTDCGARITLAGLREAGQHRNTRHAVDCPICRSRVPFAVRGGDKTGQARLTYHERPAGPPVPSSSPPGPPAAFTRGTPPRRR